MQSSGLKCHSNSGQSYLKMLHCFREGLSTAQSEAESFIPLKKERLTLGSRANDSGESFSI